MKIVSLQSENIKRLVAVEIKPDGNIVEIAGKNGQGKTSILDSIWFALAGAGVIQEKPIRKGEQKARIRLDLGDIVVTRTFNAQKDGGFTTAVSVENADGAKYSSPQAILDKLMGTLSFDPLGFARMDSKQQFNALAAMVPGIDFAAIDTEKKKDFEERTHWNRVAKESKTRADAIQVTIDGPTETIDVAQLSAEIAKASEANSEIDARLQRREDAVEKIAEMRARAKSIVEEAQKQHDRLMAEACDIETRLNGAEDLPQKTDVSELTLKAQEASKLNEEIWKRKEKTKLLDEQKRAENNSVKLTASIEAREADKRAKIAAANLPAEGIGFGEGVVLLNGVPFDQGSDAEQLRASVAIAMAMNPKLRVIRIRDGSLLDDDGMKILGEMATQKDFQVWIERVSSEGKTGFVIEAGKLKDEEAKEEASA